MEQLHQDGLGEVDQTNGIGHLARCRAPRFVKLRLPAALLPRKKTSASKRTLSHGYENLPPNSSEVTSPARLQRLVHHGARVLVLVKAQEMAHLMGDDGQEVHSAPGPGWAPNR
jgi:hypothetical protein